MDKEGHDKTGQDTYSSIIRRIRLEEDEKKHFGTDAWFRVGAPLFPYI
jgi:hypothetical protein